jgi:hypothetical protein
MWMVIQLAVRVGFVSMGRRLQRLGWVLKFVATACSAAERMEMTAQRAFHVARGAVERPAINVATNFST